MAGVNITKERGRVTGVDLKVLTGNHVDMVKKLNAPQLINELFQNEVIDQDDIILINREHVKGRRQGVEQMLSIIHESGPKAFDGFVESLRMAGFTDMADRLHKEHRSRMLQQVETETLEPKTGNVKQLTEEFEVRLEIRDLKQRMKFVEGRSNDVTDKYTRLEEGDKNKEKEIRELMERVCVLEGRSSDKFNFAKLPPFPRINTDGINTDGINTDGINTDGINTDGIKAVKGFIRRKKDLNTDGINTDEVIVERCKDWKRKIDVWLKNRKDCLDKLVKWWEGEQYKDVDVFKRDVKEWRDVLYKCLFSQVEMLDSFIEWIQFVCSLPECLYVSLRGLYDGLYVSLLWKSKDGFYEQIDVCKQLQDEVKVEIEQCINRLDQIISDEGKDNTGRSKDNKFYISISISYYGYEVDLTSAQTNFVRIYKHLKL